MELIELELIKNGWRKNNNNVYVRNKPSNTEHISWPADAYHENPQIENFWTKQRADLILKYLKNLKIKHLFEVGSGHGNVCIPLMKAGISIVALEPILEGAEKTAQAKVITINGSLSAIQECSFMFPSIGLFDVLEHIEHPSEFLASLENKLNSGGYLIITVPAHNWLFSDFDIAIGHFRRYTKKMLRIEMETSGYREIKSKYFFASLVAPAFLFRRLPYLLGRNRSFAGQGGVNQSIQRTFKLNRTIDSILYRVLKMESRFNLPIGLSLLGIYQKTENVKPF